MPHLDSLRKANDGLYFRIRRDEEYWDAVRKLARRLGSSLKYAQSKQEFHTPATSRAQVQLASIFPEEWEIIQATDADTINFTTGGE